jgi:anti-sigma B factor antagonist
MWNFIKFLVPRRKVAEPSLEPLAKKGPEAPQDLTVEPPKPAAALKVQPEKKSTIRGGSTQNISVSVSDHPQRKDVTLLSVKGFIDTTTAPEFEKTFQAVLGEKKYKLVVDLKDVNYISSAGWGIFISEIKRIRNQKGDLILVSMSPEVAEVFELLEFNTILKSFSNPDEAVKKGFERS